MAGSIRDPGWWQPYLPQLRREFSDLTMDILIAGGDAGAGAVRAGSVMVDWDVFNEDALTWLDMYLGGAPIPGLTAEGAYAWAFMLNDTTRRGVAREIDRWVRSGAPLPELERRLGSFFDDRRAHRVAVTEVTRIYASGNVMAWNASGVVDGKVWATAVDENVCPICGRLNGTMVELNRGWEFSAAALAADPALARAIRAPMTVIVPPAHVACRCWLKPVVFAAMTDEEIAAMRYDPSPVAPATPTSISPSRPPAPAGPPVSRAIEHAPRGKHRASFDRILSLIDAVHGDGTLPTIKMGVKKLRAGTLGQYWRRSTWSAMTQGIDIASWATADEATAVAAHEIGHFLDHRGLPGAAMTSREGVELMAGWREAITQSRAYQTLVDQFDNPDRYEVSYDAFTTLRPNRSHLNYLLSPEELWARSYAQYVGTRSQDAGLLAALGRDRDDPVYGSRQWEDDDFAPIAAAIDGLFKVLGWLN